MSSGNTTSRIRTVSDTRALEALAKGRYSIVRTLGRGAMGVVYEAEDRERGLRVALKTVRAPSPELIYRLKQEFRALSDLAHPNLVALYDLTVGDRTCFFTMELVDGMDFLPWVRPGTAHAGASDATQVPLGEPQTLEVSGADADPVPRFDEARVRSAFSQLSAGLIELHATGRVHRDIKPTNVRVTPEGRVVLLDFGLVADVSLQNGASINGQVVGTVAYMSPEQALGEPGVGPPTDWYGVGAVLYEALTGRVPFEGPVLRVLGDKQVRDPTPPRELIPGIPIDLDLLCRDLLRREPAARATGEAVLRRLGVTSSSRERATSLHSLGAQSFSGRTVEMLELERLFSESRQGARLAIVSGAPGIGKTALLRAFAERVRTARSNTVILEGRCFERERVRYNALDGVVDRLSRLWAALPATEAGALVPADGGLLARLFPVLGRVPAIARLSGAKPPQGDAHALRRRAHEGLRGVLGQLAEDRPVLVLLDDLQWVDEDTISLLRDLLHDPDTLRVLLVLSARSEAATTLLELATAVGVSHVDVPLSPLDEKEARALARMQLGSSASRPIIERVVREGQGSPSFLTELVRYVQAVGEGALGDAPFDLDRALLARIELLGPTARQLLELLAISGPPLSTRTLAAALRTEPARLDLEVRRLRVNQLVLRQQEELLEVHSERIRETVLRDLSRKQRMDLHFALARALEETGTGDAESLARHWLAADDLERGLTHTRRAAEEALTKLDFDGAARHFRRILRQGTLGRDEETELRIRFGDALACAGRPIEAAEQLTAAASRVTPAQRLELERRAADELLHGGHLELGSELLDQLLAGCGLRVSRTRAEALRGILVRRAWLRMRGYGWRKRDASEISPRDLLRYDALSTAAMGLGLIDPPRGLECHLRALLLALGLGEPGRVTRSLALEAGFQASMGNIGRAGTTVKLAFAAAEESTDPTSLPWACLADALRIYFACDQFGTACERFRDCAQLFSQTGGAGWAVDTANHYHCFSLLYRGELTELAERVELLIAEADARGDLFASVNLRCRLAIRSLVRGQPERVETEVKRALERWLPEDQAYLVQHFYGLHPVCEAALYEGRPDDAIERIRSALPRMKQAFLLRMPIVALEMGYLEGRCWIARAQGLAPGRDQGAAIAAARRARRACGHGTMGQGLGLLLESAATRLSGQTGGAIALLRQALDPLERSGALLYANAARFILERVASESDDRGARWMRSQRVANPERLAAMLVPGWIDPG